MKTSFFSQVFAVWTLCLGAGLARAAPLEFSCEVVTLDGKPAPEAIVHVCHVNSSDRYLDERIVASGRTDGAGRFRVRLETPADWTGVAYTIVASSKGFGSGAQAMGWNLEDRSKNSQVVKIQLRAIADCRLRLLKPDGTPAVGLHVWIDRCELPEKMAMGYPVNFVVPRLPDQLWNAVTDADGRCVIDSVPKGARPYVLHDGLDWAQVPGKHISGSKNSPVAGGEEITFSLTKAGKIAGRVVLPKGTPAANSTLRLIERSPYETAFGTVAKTNKEGCFEIAQVPASSYRLSFFAQPPLVSEWIGDERSGVVATAGQVTAMGDLALSPVALVTAQVVDADTGAKIEEPVIYRLKAGVHQLRYRGSRVTPQGYAPPEPNEGVTVEVSGGDRKNIEFRLHRLKTDQAITGVVHGVDGKPAANVAVAVLGIPNTPFPTPEITNQHGQFHFSLAKPSAKMTLLAWDGDRALADPLQAKAGDHLTLQLRESGFAQIKGQVRDEHGRPLLGATIQISLSGLAYLSGSPLPQMLQTDADGRFDVPRVWHSFGDVTLFCWSEGYGSAALRDQTLKAGQPLEWNVALKAADRTVAGMVVDSAGVAVSGVKITVSGDSQPHIRANTTTDSDGRFRIEKLAAGAVGLNASDVSDHRSRTVWKQVRAPDLEVRIILPDANGHLSGMIVDSKGEPVFGAEVDAFTRGRKTLTNRRGEFAINGIVDGWFSASVSVPGANGGKIEKSVRLKSGMTAVRIEMPTQSRERPALPVIPVDLIGRAAPDVPMATWFNGPARAMKAGGKVRILDFWGLECAPCLATFPKVQAFWDEHQRENVEIIAVNTFNPEQEVREFLAKHTDYTFPVAIQTEDSPSLLDYDVRGYPTYVVIDTHGSIVSKGHDWAEAASLALKLLGHKAP